MTDVGCYSVKESKPCAQLSDKPGVSVNWLTLTITGESFPMEVEYIVWLFCKKAEPRHMAGGGPKCAVMREFC